MSFLNFFFRSPRFTILRDLFAAHGRPNPNLETKHQKERLANKTTEPADQMKWNKQAKLNEQLLCIIYLYSVKCEQQWEQDGMAAGVNESNGEYCRIWICFLVLY